MVKKEIRILGIDDGHFNRGDERVIIVGVVMRGHFSIDGILSTDIKVDGLDSTDKIIEMIKKSKHKQQIRLIMLNGIALGGFNIVDIWNIYEYLGIPVVSIIRKKPNLSNIKRALRKFKDYQKRIELIEKAGEVYELKHKWGKTYFQFAGEDINFAKEAIKQSILRGNIPEPLRVAHLIATGITLGESRGRA